MINRKLVKKAPEKIDYDKEGMICGLEFHQQIYAPYNSEDLIQNEYGSKLFCRCPAKLREEDPDFVVKRQLRAVAGETGEVDISARFERMKNNLIMYEGYRDTTCLIELDEEPIIPINPNALYRALAIAKNIFNLQLVNEIIVSRKTIVDGSNTSGFQRTALIGYKSPDSFIEVNGKKVSIYQANLEEDSAKNTGKEGTTRKFRLDRLGIPLIEIATGPDLRSPDEALNTAMRIGELLRMTGFVKRGQGTIRQDLNVSIKRGTRIEIKGVSELDLLPVYINNESVRQVRMLDLLDEIKIRNFSKDDIDSLNPVDLSSLFKNSQAKFIKKALNKKENVIGVKLPKFGGLLGYELQQNYRVGTEFAEIAKVIAGLGGILHSDELPKFGITEKEVNQVRKQLEISDLDGFILFIASKDKANLALEGIKSTLELWISSDGLIPEVRAPRADGTTGYLRPLPGKARMYPETDSAPIYLNDDLIKKINETSFEMPEERLKRYIDDLHLSADLAEQLVIHPLNYLFEEIVSKYNVSSNLVAATILSLITDLRRKGFETDKITDTTLDEVFEMIDKDIISQDSIETILEEFTKEDNDISIKELVKAKGFEKMNKDDIEKIVCDLVISEADFIKERGFSSMGNIMGKAMSKLQGKADGKLVSSIVKTEMQKILK